MIVFEKKSRYDIFSVKMNAILNKLKGGDLRSKGRSEEVLPTY